MRDTHAHLTWRLNLGIARGLAASVTCSLDKIWIPRVVITWINKINHCFLTVFYSYLAIDCLDFTRKYSKELLTATIYIYFKFWFKLFTYLVSRSKIKLYMHPPPCVFNMANVWHDWTVNLSLAKSGLWRQRVLLITNDGYCSASNMQMNTFANGASKNLETISCNTRYKHVLHVGDVCARHTSHFEMYSRSEVAMRCQ